jgi:hypothetical protein
VKETAESIEARKACTSMAAWNSIAKAGYETETSDCMNCSTGPG